MEPALAILLISALTTNGLLALWAATSPRHWFLRTTLYFACLSPLLLVPAYEPLIALTLQAAVISGGVTFLRLLDRRANGAAAISESQGRWRFSLSTMMQLMSLLGIASAIAARLPTLNSFAWQSIVAIGLCSGLSLASAYWASTVNGWKRIAALLAALAASIFLGAILGGVDWFVLSALGGGWVEEYSGIGITILSGDRDATAFIGEWMLILPISALASLVVVWLCQFLYSPSNSDTRSRKRPVLASVCVTVTCAVLAAPAVQMLIILLNPEPIPVVMLPSPNGHDELVAARDMLSDNLVVDSGGFDRDAATRPELLKAVAEVRAAIERNEQGLPLETMRSLDYSLNSEIAFDDIQPTRSLARAIDAAGRLAEVEGDYAQALRWHLNGVKHGFASRRGGLIVDDLVGVACTGIGLAGVFEIRQHLDRQQCAETIAAINELIAHTEPFADVAYRDRVWTQRAMGWMAHLSQLLDPEYHSGGSYESARQLELAKCRLLMAELAIVAFEKEHGRLPSSAEELLSEMLPAMPIDPLSPTGAPLQFKRTETGYALYSVGRDGVDNHGEPPASGMSAGWGEPGDVRLDIEFSPQTVTEITTISPAVDADD